MQREGLWKSRGKHWAWIQHMWDGALTVQVRVERHGGGGVLPAGVRAGVCKGWMRR
jgi:hypothetical protein